jgi:hypothetical protein
VTTPDFTDPSIPTLADTLASRIQSLQQAHPWMDPAATVTLAGSSTSTTEAHGIADSLKQQVQSRWDGISHFFDDPVLQQKPTANMALQRYITGSVGAWPVSDSSLSHIQGQLQAKGFGKDLPVNGVWNASWQIALQQHATTEYNDQLAGNKPGSKSAGGFLHSLLGAITPSGVADSVWGFVKSVPADLGQLASDFGAGLQDFGSSVFDWRSYAPGTKAGGEQHQELKQQDKATSLALQNKLGVNAYRQAVGLPQQNEENYNSLVNGINDIGTIFLLSGAGKAASGISSAVRKEAAAGLTTRLASHEAASRGQGVITKSLLKPLGTRIATGAVTGAAAGGLEAQVTGGDVGKGIGTGFVLGGVTGAALPKRAFDNLPVLRNSGPTLGKLFADDGLYYTARTRLATPYQYGAVRAAGTAFSQAQVFSLKARGVGYLEHLFGPDAGTIQQSIDTTHVLDPINDALRNKLSFTGAGLHFSPDLDYLMYFLHGPMTVGAEGTASRSIGDSVKSSTDGFNAALQHVGAIGQIEQGTGKSYDTLLKLAGGDPDRLHLWMSNKVKQHAAMQHAEEVLNRLRVTDQGATPGLFTDDHYDLLRSEAAAVWNDPEAMRTAVARMLGSGENYLARNIQNELARAAVSPDKHLRHELSDYLDAGDVLTHRVLPHADRYLLTPTPTTVVPRGIDPEVWGGTIPEELTPTVSQMRRGAVIPGSLGLARLHTTADGVEDVTRSTLTSQQATRDLHDVQQELATAETDQARHAITNRALDYLFHNYGLDARKLSVFDSTPQKLVSLMEDRAKQLAAEVHLTADAPEQLKQAFAAINAKGYRVVSGTDIGHAYRSDLPPLEELGAPISQARKVVSALGLNPQSFSRLDYGADRRLRVTRVLQQAVDEGRISLPPFYTVQTLLNDLQDDAIVGKQLPWAANVLFAASRRAHQGSIEELIRTGAADDAHAAEARLKANIAMAGGLRQLSVKDVRRVLTRTDKVPWVTATKDEAGFVDAAHQMPLMSTEHATEVWKALQKGYSETPAYMLGLQKVEDFARYLPFRFRDALARGTTVKGVKIPAVPGVAAMTDNAATLALMSLPTKIAQLRDTYRFNLSPYFSLRRIAKTNLKMGADGVVPTLTPVRSLTERGQYDEAHRLLDRVLGSENPRYKYLDEADRYLDSQDVFGLYNARHYEAYYAQAKQEQGWTDEQIHNGLIRVFMYGAPGREGRTALERSVNVVFFPFSFEKTVARNIGGYLLDKPAQALVLSNALDAYRDFNNHHLSGDNPLAASWYEQHLPLLDEVLRLNAFAHGVSPGELGGINRPLLNAFLPQSWQTDKTTNATLGRFVPAITDLKRILKEGSEQSRIVRQSVVNGAAVLQGDRSSILNERPSNKTMITQRAEATQYRNTLINAFQQVLDYNDSVSTDEEKYHFGGGPGVPTDLHGAVISRMNIGRIVHQHYPVYDPFSGAAFAIQRDNEAQIWLAQRQGTQQYTEYRDFYDKAKTAISHLNADDYPPEQAAQVQEMFHAVAIDFASKDPAFYKWYRRTFANALGPLEQVR